MAALNLNKDKLFKSVIDVLPKELTPAEQRLSIQIYRLLAKGEPVAWERLAESLDISLDEANDILKDWIGVYYNDENHIIGYWGLALLEMDHRFIVDGRILYTWCAWDSLFIPELLGKTVIIESTCPETERPIRLIAGPDGVKSIDPAEAVMSILTVNQEKLNENIMTNFCHFIYFFSSESAGKRWASKHEGTYILSIEDGVNLSKMKNRTQYKDIFKM